jgi:hypothetical protein
MKDQPGKATGQAEPSDKSKGTAQTQPQDKGAKPGTQAQQPKEQGSKGNAQTQPSKEQGSKGAAQQPESAKKQDTSKGGAAKGTDTAKSSGTANRIQLSEQQRTNFYGTLLKQSNVNRVTNVNVPVNVGTRVPRSVRLVALPAEVISIVPQYRSYRYFVQWVLRFVEHRVGDPRLISLIRRWLKAGVLEGGTVHPNDAGTPQGGSISVLLSNLYLHYVLDLWFERVVNIDRTLYACRMPCVDGWASSVSLWNRPRPSWSSSVGSRSDTRASMAAGSAQTQSTFWA